MTNDTHVLESQGLYRIPEAARLLGTTLTSANGHAVLPNKLRYWIRTSTVPARPISPFARHRLISFRDLVSLRLVAVLRSRDVALRDIRETEEWLRKNLDIDWPFISRPLWTYASDVYTEFESHLVVASRAGQRAMDFLRQWLTSVDLDMSFDENDLVSAWLPHKDITIDPRIQIGQPCVSDTRIPSRAVWGKLRAGDSIGVVARLYDLTEEQIRHADEWESRLIAA